MNRESKAYSLNVLSRLLYVVGLQPVVLYFDNLKSFQFDGNRTLK